MSVIKVTELAYVRLQVPDIEQAERFFNLFGLATRARIGDKLLLRGSNQEHHLLVLHEGERKILSTAYEVASEDDLDVAAKLDGASLVLPLAEAGGKAVTLSDPDGNVIELVHGIPKTESMDVAPQYFNSASERDRRRNAIVRPIGPSRVLRIGHTVMKSPNVERMVEWYGSTLGLLESDDVPLPHEEGLLMSFLRLDQGSTYVDHHVLQILHGNPNMLHHISFEVQDIDDLHCGHEALAAAGYSHVWGIGRHMQGSQIFDYWLDPFGVMYEHWTDTDMFNAEMSKGVTQLDSMRGGWGPPMPHAFIEQETR